MSHHASSARCHRHRDQISSLLCRAERDIAAGEEVCISYGNLSDAELLRIYGFVEEVSSSSGCSAVPNPHNFVSIRTDAVFHACQVCGGSLSHTLRQHMRVMCLLRPLIAFFCKLNEARSMLLHRCQHTALASMLLPGSAL